MLPSVTSAKTILKTGLFGALALAIGLGAPSPAQALGKNEQKFLQGVAAAIVVDRILDDVRRQQPRRQHQPIYAPPPVYAAPPVYAPPAAYVQPQYRPHRPKPQPVYRTSIYATPAAQAFNAYGPTDRRRIQQQLAARGYYRSGIDGSFGPGTYNAIVGYANDRGQSRSLGTTAGVFGLFDGLVY
ncbi:peptidoglycan-binding domain-containing protein [Gemmobacter serpentinus]|uniref:peptidoglycan-binding domain-containing protein n=1 Tax=Gemmobacter serpentinus TaxID=2652247 RepID=UPI00124DA3FA|nr:peptidoglycan-binding protein [Gemmobacter serpentinus]